jgi:hypothetical protein
MTCCNQTVRELFRCVNKSVKRKFDNNIAKNVIEATDVSLILKKQISRYHYLRRADGLAGRMVGTAMTTEKTVLAEIGV